MSQYIIEYHQFEKLLDLPVKQDLSDFLNKLQDKNTLREFIDSIKNEKISDNNILYVAQHIFQNKKTQSIPIHFNNFSIDLEKYTEDQLAQILSFGYQKNKEALSVTIQSNHSLDEIKSYFNSDVQELSPSEYLKNSISNMDMKGESNTNNKIDSIKKLSELMEDAKTIDDVKILLKNISPEIQKNQSYISTLIRLNNKHQVIDFDFYFENNNEKTYPFRDEDFINFIVHRISSHPEIISHLLKTSIESQEKNKETSIEAKEWIEKTKSLIIDMKFNSVENTQKHLTTMFENIEKRYIKNNNDEAQAEAKMYAIAGYFEIIPKNILFNEEILNLIDDKIQNFKTKDITLIKNIFDFLDKDQIKNKEDLLDFSYNYPNLFLKFRPQDYLNNILCEFKSEDIISTMKRLGNQNIIDNIKNFNSIFKNTNSEEFLSHKVVKYFIENFPQKINAVFNGYITGNNDFIKVNTIIKDKEIFNFAVEHNCWTIASESSIENIREVKDTRHLLNILNSNHYIWETEDIIVKDWIRNKPLINHLIESKTLSSLDLSDHFYDELLKHRDLLENIAINNKDFFANIVNQFYDDIDMLKIYIKDMRISEYKILSDLKKSPLIPEEIWINHDFAIQALQNDIYYIKHLDKRTLNNKDFILKILKEVDNDKIHADILNSINYNIKKTIIQENLSKGQYFKFFNSIISYNVLNKNLEDESTPKKKIKI